MFIDDTKERIAEINVMKESGEFNAEDMVRHFHTIKSSAASVGAVRLSEFAKKMEDFVKHSEITSIADNLSRFEAEFVRSTDLLLSGINGVINEKS